MFLLIFIHDDDDDEQQQQEEEQGKGALPKSFNHSTTTLSVRNGSDRLS